MSAIVESLPTEVLTMIFELCSTKTLLSVARVSKRWHQIALTNIYHCVYYRELGNLSSFIYGEGKYKEWQESLDIHSGWVTYIHNIKRFHKTIKRNTLLRSLVVCAGIKIHRKANKEELVTINRLLLLLAPSLHFLWVAGTTQHYNFLTKNCQIRALSFSLGSVYNLPHGKKKLKENEYHRSVLLIPTLEHLSYEWPNPWWKNDPPGVEEYRKSQIKELRLRYDFLTGEGELAAGVLDQRNGNHIVELLDRIQALEKFELEGVPGSAKLEDIGNYISPLSIYQDLKVQKESLLEICMSLDHDTLIAWQPVLPENMQGFADFTCLKRLAIPLAFLLAITHGQDVSALLWQLLPPTLEDLLLEYPYDSLCEGTFLLNLEEDWQSPAAGGSFFSTKNVLLNIAEYKSQRFSRLRKVALWRFSGMAFDEKSDEAVQFDFKDAPPELEDVLTKLSAVQIHLSIWQLDPMWRYAPLYRHRCYLGDGVRA